MMTSIAALLMLTAQSATAGSVDIEVAFSVRIVDLDGNPLAPSEITQSHAKSKTWVAGVYDDEGDDLCLYTIPDGDADYAATAHPVAPTSAAADIDGASASAATAPSGSGSMSTSTSTRTCETCEGPLQPSVLMGRLMSAGASFDADWDVAVPHYVLTQVDVDFDNSTCRARPGREASPDLAVQEQYIVLFATINGSQHEALIIVDEDGPTVFGGTDALVASTATYGEVGFVVPTQDSGETSVSMESYAFDPAVLDLDEDGVIECADAKHMLVDGLSMRYLDLTGDGTVDADDAAIAVRLIRLVAGSCGS